MMHFGAGNHMHRIVTVLSVTGEFPMCSIYMLGNERVFKQLIHNLASKQVIRNDSTGEEVCCKVIRVSGKGYGRTIRLYKEALVLLDWLHEAAYGYYMSSFRNHRFSGDASHWERNHRVAEAVILCIQTGIETRPYLLPGLQNERLLHVIPEAPSFYLSKDIKKTGFDEMNKTMFTRMTGAVFSYGRCYAVYNTRKSVMKWNGMGEYKAKLSLTELVRMNSGVKDVDSAILFGRSYETVLDTILESEKDKRPEFRFDSIYRHIYFIPLNELGIRQLRIMLLPDWNARLLDLVFGEEWIGSEERMFEYDAYIDNKYIFSFLDGDIARLIRFREAAGDDRDSRYEVVCYPHQLEETRKYLGGLAGFQTIDMTLVEQGLKEVVQ